MGGKDNSILHLADIVFASMALSQVVLVGLFFMLYYRRQLLGQLLVLFSVCLTAYIIVNAGIFDHLTHADLLFGSIATATPAILWIIAYYLFADRNSVHGAIWWLISGYMLLRILGLVFFDPQHLYAAYLLGAGYVVPQLAMLGFALHAVYLAFAGYEHDLLEERRPIRVAFVVIMGIQLALILVNGLSTTLGSFIGHERLQPLIPNWFFSLSILMSMTGVMLAIFRLRGGSFDLLDRLREDGKVEFARVGADKDKHLVERVQQAMLEGRFYAKPGLTIAELADKVSLQQYQLRGLINNRMRYRNFSQYTNEFRIKDACERLLGTDDPISSIALDVGFTSLSSFHRAFRDSHAMTPREYRIAARAAQGPVSLA